MANLRRSQRLKRDLPKSIHLQPSLDDSSDEDNPKSTNSTDSSEDVSWKPTRKRNLVTSSKSCGSLPLSKTHVVRPLYYSLAVEGDEWEVVQYGTTSSTATDVSIFLVPNQINLIVPLETKSHHGREILAELKVHASRLKECSKYFETCLSERWSKQESSSSLEFYLEVHGEVGHYKECFAHMYTPLLGNFTDVGNSMELLKVAFQIEYQGLMSSLCRYLSAIHHDEWKLQQDSYSSEFLQNRATDLVARLSSSGSNNKECWNLSISVIKHCITTALCQKDACNLGCFFYCHVVEELFHRGIGQGAFEKNLVTIISKEAKDMIVQFHGECNWGNLQNLQNCGFAVKLATISWILGVLLKAQVAEEVVECMVNLDRFARFCSYASNFGTTLKTVVHDFAMITLTIYREVIAGHLLLGIPDRVALLLRWRHLCKGHVKKRDYMQAIGNMFMTLPFEQRLDLLKLEGEDFELYVDPSWLASMLTSEWFNGEEFLKGGVVTPAAGDIELEVCSILDSRFSGRGRKLQYLVSWQRYGQDQNSWEPAGHLQNAPKSVKKFQHDTLTSGPHNRTSKRG